MKEFDYVPKGVTGDDGEFRKTKFEGKVRLKIPSYEERIRLAQDMSISDLKKTKDGKVDLKSGIEVAGKMLKKVTELVVDVDLHYGEHSFKSIEDLQYYKEGNDIVKEIGHVLMHGLSLGES